MVKGYGKEIALGIFLFSLPYIIPIYGIGVDVSTLVATSSTIFTIFAGFLIADAMSNYLRLQSLIAEENSSLVTIANNAEQIDKDGSTNVHKAIDEYMIAQLDLNTLNHFSQTQKQIDNIHSSIYTLKVAQEDEVMYDHTLAMEEKIIAARQEMSLAAKKTLTPIHWVTLISLAILVIVSLLPIRNGEWLTNIFAGLMILGIEAILVILRDMDNNKLLESKLSYENPREIFHAIGKPPYYPFSSPIQAQIPDENGQIRLGKKSSG